MNLEARMDSLKTRHSSLEDRIHAEDVRPKPDDEALRRLKVEKLRVKEELARLQREP